MELKISLTSKISGISTYGSELEWLPNTYDSTYVTNVHFGVGDTSVRRIELYVKNTGPIVSVPITTPIDVVPINTTAVAGTQFILPNGFSATISADSLKSQPIYVDIKPSFISGQEPLQISLCLVDSDDTTVTLKGKQYRINITKVPDTLIAKTIQLERPGWLPGFNMIDISIPQVYTRNEANREPSIQKKIDFGLWSSSSKGMVFLTMTDDVRLGGWSSGQYIRDVWDSTNKSDGEMMKVPSSYVTSALFQDVVTPSQFFNSFTIAESIVDTLNTFDYGPGRHVHFLAPGDIVYFRSLARNVRAIARVDSTILGADGSVNLNVKSIVEPN